MLAALHELLFHHTLPAGVATGKCPTTLIYGICRRGTFIPAQCAMLRFSGDEGQAAQPRHARRIFPRRQTATSAGSWQQALSANARCLCAPFFNEQVKET